MNRIQVIPSGNVFKSGDGSKVYSKYRAIIPAKIGKAECYIQTEIVKLNTVIVK